MHRSGRREAGGAPRDPVGRKGEEAEGTHQNFSPVAFEIPQEVVLAERGELTPRDPIVGGNPRAASAGGVELTVVDENLGEALRAGERVVRSPAGFFAHPHANGSGGGGAEGVGGDDLINAGVGEARGRDREMKRAGIIVATGHGCTVFGPRDGGGRGAGIGRREITRRAGLKDRAEAGDGVTEDGSGFDDRENDGGSRDGGAEGIGGRDGVGAGIGSLEIEERKRVGGGPETRERVVGDDDAVAFPLVGDGLGRGDGNAENGGGATRGDGAAEG